ncbi:F-box domain, Skp2 [Beauveria bassiana ARSEF 2860]|uniref:F-box domain, Skp2 n=1 Tax=Beauveria bassiana (strain ARSEF 2860) TaxID=655819 RepID=J4UFT1_BEAB2|nr:F-box domain, Skp2 [Beauveria bassiana ARSEF 2860]EJP61482.1 F-box domain, Skp2 [Beauveria bassiana ARSEF 2860]
MNIATPDLSRLERLPAEIIQTVLRFLHPWEIKALSSTSKRLRRASLSNVFRRVKFKFSLAGIEELKSLLKSNACSHVASFTYEITQLLKPEILDFSCFRSTILTTDNYVDMAKAMYDDNEDACGFPSYMTIYETVRDLCREQHSIIDEGADLLLSSVFCALPLLKEVRLSFCEVLEFDYCLLIPDIIMKDEFYRHHLEVATIAIQNARRRGVAINTVGLYDYELPHFDVWEKPDLTSLSRTLSRLLENVKVLRLSGSECVLELLSHCALGLHQLDMCEVAVADTALKNFLEANKKTIRSIGFHQTKLYPESPYRDVGIAA